MATLKPSQQGLAKIKQARSGRGWSVDDFRWLESASQILGTCWQTEGVLAAGISEGTWKRFLAGKYAINAEAFKAYCQVLEIDWQEVVEFKESKNPKSKIQNRYDWGEVPDVSIFHGRWQEIEKLKQWIVGENCRLITLLGMGGIGKTALSVKLAQQLQNQFEFIIWRSLRNAPPIEDILAEAIQFVSKQQETNLPSLLDSRISLLLKYLRASRCLLIVDNVESILEPSSRDLGRSGYDRDKYGGYGQLFQSIGETQHQSCLILTSREKPRGLAALEGEKLPVRSLQLTGLPSPEIRSIFKVKGSFVGSDREWGILVDRYAGNPLALKIVASAVREFFEGNIADFLEFARQGTFIFDDIRDLLDGQFQRLSAIEKEIMYWLAIEREPISFARLLDNMVVKVPRNELLNALASLQHRSLIEKNASSIAQQPVVMEYITLQAIERTANEIANFSTANTEIQLLRSHALVKARAKDYLRDTQVSLILKPLADRLLNIFGSPSKISDRLKQILESLRGRSPLETGYAAGNILNLLRQLEIDVSGYDFSDLTVWQANLQGMNLHEVNFANSDLSESVFTETLGNILSATFSPDGQLLATCDTDCNVRLWEVATGKLHLVLEGHLNWVRSVAFSPIFNKEVGGRILASGAADCTAKIWDIDRGICLHTCSGHTNEVFALAFSGDGKILVTSSADCTLKLWQVSSGECLNTCSEHESWIRSVAFSYDSRFIASGSDDRTIKLWEAKSGNLLETLTGHSDSVRSVAFSSDGRILASGSSDRTIKFWQIETGNCLKTLSGHSEGVYSIAFSPDDRTLASGSGDCTVRLWQVSSGQCWKTLHGPNNQIFSVAFSADNRTLACVSLDRTVRLWDCQTSKCLKAWCGHTDWAFPVAFSADDRTLASGSNDNTIKLWDLQTNTCLRTFSGHTDSIFTIAISNDGQTLASGSNDCTIKLWNLKSGSCWKTLHGHGDWVRSIAFSSDGRILASGSADCTVKLWDSISGNCLGTLEGHSEQVYSVAFSPDGQTLISGSTDRTLKLWDIVAKKCWQTFTGHSNRVFGVAFSSDGQTLASASTDNTVKLWHIRQGKCWQTLTGHTNWVFAVAFSPDGQILASASHDRTVRLWDVNTGKCLHVCFGHDRLVSSVAFSPSGQIVASGSQDQTARIWCVKTGECLKILRAKRLYEDMNLTGVKGLTEATIATLRSLGAI